jgi:hypothetical protein
MGAVKTQGSDLYVLVPAGSGDATIMRVSCVTDLTGVGAGAADQVETTCLSELTDRAFVRGLKSPSAVSGTINYDANDASLQELQALNDSGVSTQWFVGFSDGSVPGVSPDARPRPTLVADVPTFPATRTFVEFTGFVSELGLDLAANSVVKNPLSIQRSGAVVYHRATTPLAPQ